MNNFDPTRMVPQAAPAMPGADLTAFFAAMPPQMQMQGLPQMQMPVHAGMPGPQQWQGQFWPQQMQQQWIPGPGPGAGPQIQAVPQPSLQNVLASAYQVWAQQQQQQQQPQLYPPPPPPAAAAAAQQQAQMLSHVGSMMDDEARLIEALKGCKTKGLTPRQALEKLHGVNNHSASDWKDHFLDHLERLYAHVRPPVGRGPSVSNGPSSQAGRSSISTLERPANAQQRQRPPASYNIESHHSKKTSRHRVEPRLPEPKIPRSLGRCVSPPPRRAENDDDDDDDDDEDGDDSGSPSPRPRAPPVPISGSRRTRREPVPDFHAGTRIPFTEGRMKPEPPLLEDAGAGGKFTPADHCFFIHYLRWRLAKDPLVAREVLYEELAEQTPSHDADAWRRHWDNDPEMPDRVVIDAGKRALSSGDGRALAPRADSAPSRGEDDDASKRPPDAHAPTHARAKNKKRKRMEVTEEDFKAMAQYMLDHADNWDMSVSRRRRWSEFAARPQNAKRSLDAWCGIERTNDDDLQYYFKMLKAARRSGSEGEGPQPSSGPPTTKQSSHRVSSGKPEPPAADSQLTTTQNTHGKVEKTLTSLVDHEHKPPAPSTSAIPDGSGHRSRKRSAEELIPKLDESPERKRPKAGTPPEVIVVSD